MKPNKIAIASCTPCATDAASQVALSGGNAIDAAVAGAFDLMVSNILMCSIGGGGFATVKTPGKDPVVFDFFDAMPGIGLNKSEFGKNIRKVRVPYGIGIDVITGYSSIGVPGTAKGLELIANRAGNLPLKESLKPAIAHAKGGIPLNATVAYWLSISAEKIHWLTEYSKSLLSTPDGAIPKEGFFLKNPDLARTFEIIGDEGTDPIYRGEIAKSISEHIRQGGGLVTTEDLRNYQVIERVPLSVKYGKYDIYTNPPPSVGGKSLVHMLEAVSNLGFKGYTPDTAAKIGRIIHTALSNRHSKTPNTTQISCVDDLGNACSITMSMGYGSGVAVPGTGIFFGNTLGEPELNPLGFHALEPGTRLVSSMAPTVCVDSGNNNLLVLGTPGASRIAPAIMQTVINIADLGLAINDAVSRPRIHWEDGKLVAESNLDINESLVPDEWEIVKFDDINMYFGGIQCVSLSRESSLEAVSDPRRCGKSTVVEC